MPDLIAQGAAAHHRWRRTLPRDEWLILGRATPEWSVPWDERVSREHAELLWDGKRLHVRRLATARNPIFVQGEPVESFDLLPGQHFVIGDTTLVLLEERVEFSAEAPSPMEEHAFSVQHLRRTRFRDADQRLEVLSGLPKVIASAGSDTELFVNFVNMLLAGVPRAEAVALVAVAAETQAEGRIELLQWDRRRTDSRPFQPSERLIRQAIERGETVAHIWRSRDEPQMFTASENTDWAFCTPVRQKTGFLWAIYVSGQFPAGAPDLVSGSDPTSLREDVKFAELAAEMVSSLRELRSLERRTAGLSQFFSPPVLKALSAQDPDIVLAPQVCEVSVLFCDLRGFSRASEQAGDDLVGLLDRVSRALGVATREILAEGGVVGDFHGDAVMGFWGWPLAQEGAALRACRAALRIRAEFEQGAQRPTSSLAGFRLGIGVATGKAVAGKIGTADQVKVTVFGPVVNLASRLEGMTKILKTPILIDERTAQIVRPQMSHAEAHFRRVALVQPYGLATPLEPTELLPSTPEEPALSEQNLADYEAAVDAFKAGRWTDALALLNRVPPEDQVKDFLVVYIAQRNRTPPSDWHGVVELESKS
jgi:adenylate cyclase